MSEVWRQMAVPESPALEPEAALATLRTAPGFRVELVAAEPLVEDPVAIAWDHRGRLWAVEMRGFMPDVDGTGEQEPVGRVVILEDLDQDGRPDRSTVFLDRLVLPRAVAPLGDGALIAEPPHLWLCRDRDDDRICDSKAELARYGDPHPDAVEHTENGLLWGLDNWIYSAKSDRRFRLIGERLLEQPTAFRGQWGIDQDDWGRLFYNHNSRYLLADLLPAEYLLRNPRYRPAGGGPGVGERVVLDEMVHPIRVNPGINRGYQPHMLRPDGRLRLTTSVSGLAVYRGDQFPESFRGDVFIPEPAGNVVTHHRILDQGIELRSEHVTYADETWGEREFLASTDERFRPVDCAVGPDGALYVVDFYRGVLQHRRFLTTFLRRQILERGLERPLGLGRIYRVVWEDGPIEHRPPALDDADQRLAALGHRNGWIRDTAQRLLVEAGDRAVVPRLVSLARASDSVPARLHALWSLAGLGALDGATVLALLEHPDARLVVQALRAAPLAADLEARALERELLARLEHADPALRLQVILSMGELADRPRLRQALIGVLLEHPEDRLLAGAALSGLGGYEQEARERVVGALGGLDGAAGGERSVDLVRIAEQLAEMLSPEAAGPVDDLARNGAPEPVEPEVLAAGRRLYRACAICHGESGRGEAGLGPALVGSRLVAGEPALLVALLLNGLESGGESSAAARSPADPGQRWRDPMPGFRNDRRFSDPAIAALSTWLRQAWGGRAGPVSPALVGRVRAQLAGLETPFSVDELRRLRPRAEEDP